jgi:hypothetical protein
MLRDTNAFFAKLERGGEPAAREALAQGAYGSKRPLVEEWLRRKATEREEAANARNEGRKEKHVDFAQEANDIARSSLKTARAAYRMAALSVFVALVAALVAALAYVAKA